MAGEIRITFQGHLTGDPELRFTHSGRAVCNFSVANNPTYFDRERGEFVDKDPVFMQCNAWGDLGERIVESLRRGMRVWVEGRLGQRTYETKEGEKRTVMELTVDDAGPSLKFATAVVTKATKPATSRPAGREQQAPAAADDPWAPPAADLVGAGSGPAPF